MTIKIYGAAASTFVRTVRMAAEEKGIAYEMARVGDGTPGSLGSAEHRKLHPFGKIPAFSDGEVTLWESTAICRYIDEAYDGPRLQPEDLLERVRMDQWISAGMDYVIPNAVRNYVQQFIFPSGANGKPDMAKIEVAKPKVREHMLIMDQQLGGRTWLAGDSITIADLLFAPALSYVGSVPGGMDAFEGCENLGRWWQAVSDRDSFKATAAQAPVAGTAHAAE